MKFSNEAQEVTVAGTSVMRDSIALALREHLDDQPKFKQTVVRFHPTSESCIC